MPPTKQANDINVDTTQPNRTATTRKRRNPAASLAVLGPLAAGTRILPWGGSGPSPLLQAGGAEGGGTDENWAELKACRESTSGSGTTRSPPLASACTTNV